MKWFERNLLVMGAVVAFGAGALVPLPEFAWGRR